MYPPWYLTPRGGFCAAYAAPDSARIQPLDVYRIYSVETGGLYFRRPRHMIKLCPD